jgi:uncharacterized protein (TIGR01777 family)
MNILISGARGFIGSNLSNFLSNKDHDLFKLVRKNPVGENEIKWNPYTGEMNHEKINKINCVIHLSGENLASGPWTKNKKKKILESRVISTQNLVKIFSELKHPPRIFLSASAIGYYGNRGDELLDEDSSSGFNFLADVCKQWEEAANPATDLGIRTVNLRIGLVLSKTGGSLPKILLPFQFGLGGKIGNGKQYISWITLADLLSSVNFIIEQENLWGPVNLASPNAVTNFNFTKILGKVLVRPTFFRLPESVINLAMGDVGRELLLASLNVIPKKLLAHGFSFKNLYLEGALRSL